MNDYAHKEKQRLLHPARELDALVFAAIWGLFWFLVGLLAGKV